MPHDQLIGLSAWKIENVCAWGGSSVSRISDEIVFFWDLNSLNQYQLHLSLKSLAKKAFGDRTPRWLPLNRGIFLTAFAVNMWSHQNWLASEIESACWQEPPSILAGNLNTIYARFMWNLSQIFSACRLGFALYASWVKWWVSWIGV